MTQVRANGPRISPGWLAGLLAAEAQCEWASWFRVRHEDWEQGPVPSLSDLEWSIDYTQRLNRCIKLYEDQGYTVSNGGPNGYVLSVGGAELSGRPDVIATKGGDCIVIDFPEGEPTRSHALQVMIHIYALSMAVERFQGMTLSGQLAYGRESVDIPAASEDREFTENMTELARRLTAGRTARPHSRARRNAERATSQRPTVPKEWTRVGPDASGSPILRTLRTTSI